MMKLKMRINGSIEIQHFQKFPELKEFYIKCIKSRPEERPSISELLIEFYQLYHSKMPEIECFNKYFNFKQQMHETDKSKKVENLIILAEQNDPSAQFNLSSWRYKCTRYKQSNILL